ncbi:MAG: DNA translocase FtsK 4TM domain-containing protein [Clostridia bacterium]|nr:DNA translocase FtsK 4TM domain-containing protein [Clostridia bacterium]
MAGPNGRARRAAKAGGTDTSARPSRRAPAEGGLPPEIRREAAGILWLGLAALVAAGLVAPEGGWLLRAVGSAAAWLLGRGAWWVPGFLAATAGLLLTAGPSWSRERGRLLGVALAAVVTVAWLARSLPPDRAFALAREGGGLVGASVWTVLARLLGGLGAEVVLATCGALALVLAFQVRLSHAFSAALRRAGRALVHLPAWLKDFLFEEVDEPRRRASRAPSGDAEASRDAPPSPPGGDESGAPAAEAAGPALPSGPAASVADEGGGDPASGPIGPVHVGEPRAADPPRAPDAAPPAGAKTAASALQISLDDYPTYRLPPLSLLRAGAAGDGAGGRQGARPADRDRGARILEETLSSFGIRARVVGIDRGPAVTRYELQPAAGVKVSRIVSLQDDIALALAATGVRVVAPIPGKSAVGIEVPNRDVRTVPIREVLESPAFQRSASRLTLAIGEDVAGQPIVATLDRMLHVLIAGATGSGKSVCLNTLLVSLLFKARPDEVKLLLVDPKRVELSGWNGVPHLLAPVITDPKAAAGALRWVQQEMVRRYELFADWGARDIHRFNEAAQAQGRRRLPFIVVVIDELADLMLVAARDVEDVIQRLAQMARAAGIHLVVATQRPSVDVITGVIKANIPSRIAFGVSSQADSRTILDAAGAEKLLGKGDMLFHPLGAPKPVRAQGAFISEQELEAVLDFVRREAAPEFDEEVTRAFSEGPVDDDEPDDELFQEAVRVVLETGQASVSMLQRRLRVGFTRAGRLIDMMERRGFVGPHKGSKAREVLVTREMFQRAFGRPPGPPAGGAGEGSPR